MMKYDRLFIGGELRKSAGAGILDVIEPSTGELFGQVPLATTADAAAAVAAAREAFDHGPWPRMSMGERRAVLRQAGKLLDMQAEELNDLVTHENGLLRRYGWGSTRSFFDAICVLNPGETFQREGIHGATGRIVTEPIGVVAAIVPWNGPLALALLKLLPALLAGCTVILKPAPETPIDSYFLGQAFADAGLRRVPSTSSSRTGMSPRNSCAAEASTWCPSPAAPRRAGGSVRSAASRSSTSTSNSGASPPRSSWRISISPPPSPRCSAAGCCSTAARPALRSRGYSSRNPGRTRSSRQSATTC